MRLRLFRDNSGDWEGLYKDGALLEQGHSVDWPWTLKLAGVDIEVVDVEVGELAGARFPDNERDIPDA